MAISLSESKIDTESEKRFTVVYNNKTVGSFKVDLMAVGKVTVEIKAVTGVMPKHFED